MSPPRRASLFRQHAVALEFLALRLAMTANGFRPFAHTLLAWLFVVTAPLHLAEDALALHPLFEDFESLIDVVVANRDEQMTPAFKKWRWHRVQIPVHGFERLEKVA